MSFLKRLFGQTAPQKHVDEHGIYVYVHNTRCDAYVRVRIDRRHDLNHTDDGFVWHKTIVDSKCFSQMRAVVHFDKRYQVISQEISPPGVFIDEAAYLAATAPAGGGSGFS